MIKFLFFTDTHIRTTSPSSRVDVFKDSLYEKFIEIGQIGTENNVDFYVHGGDLFDRPDISLLTVRNFTKVLTTYKKPIFFVPGNHDIFAYNLESLNRTVMALLDDLGVLYTMYGHHPIYFSKGETSVQLSCAPYSYELDLEEGREGYIVKNKLADFAFHFAHGMLLDRPFEGVHHTLIDQIKETEADVTISGHYHTGFSTKYIDGKYFANPGSIARVAASKFEMERMPKVLILSCSRNEGVQIKEIFLSSAKPGKDIFDRSLLEIKKREQVTFESIKASIEEAVDNEMISVGKIIEHIAQIEKLDKKIIDHALQLVAEVNLNES
ncbi:MAG: metallophosphoesterase [Tissierellia bacterium]|nr:metallophosphoesterase [Tissierellia bacterium]